MSEIYHRGPIVCSISTPDDFTYGYRGGLYDDPKNYTKETIDHNVEVDSNSQQPQQPPRPAGTGLHWLSSEGMMFVHTAQRVSGNCSQVAAALANVCLRHP